jgi:hypothetical protein
VITALALISPQLNMHLAMAFSAQGYAVRHFMSQVRVFGERFDVMCVQLGVRATLPAFVSVAPPDGKAPGTQSHLHSLWRYASLPVDVPWAGYVRTFFTALTRPYARSPFRSHLEIAEAIGALTGTMRPSVLAAVSNHALVDGECATASTRHGQVAFWLPQGRQVASATNCSLPVFGSGTLRTDTAHAGRFAQIVSILSHLASKKSKAGTLLVGEDA